MQSQQVQIMVRKNSSNSISGALFEDDYVIRTLGRIGHEPETALTELVANAWDAGAFNVKVIVPEHIDGLLTVEDNGHGMTKEQFKARWMTLGYDRTKSQGIKVKCCWNEKSSIAVLY